MVGLMHDDAAVAILGAWLFCTLLFTVIVLRSVYRWRGETTAPCDPAFDPALREDRSTATCEAIPIPGGEWSEDAREGLRRMAGWRETA